MKFRAAVLVESHQPLEVLEIELENRLSSGQVLVKIDLAGLCGSQIGEIDAIKGVDRYLPHLLGHEGIGEVIEIGPDVTRVKEGDVVVAHWMKGLGKSAEPPVYKNEIYGQVNSGQVAIFSEFAVVSEDRLTKLERPIDKRIAAIMGCALLTAYGVVSNELAISRKDNASLLVVGFGGIGESIALLAQAIKSLDIYVVEPRRIAAEKASTLGFHVVRTSELSRMIFDMAVDTSGSASSIELAYHALSKNGILSLVGVSPQGSKISIDPMPLHYGRSIRGSFGGSVDVDRDLPELINLVESIDGSLQSLIGETFPLARINDAIKKFRDGVNPGRCLIDFA